MNPAQFELLMMLREHPRLSQKELAQLMDADQTTLSRNMKLVIAQKWVKRAVSKEDRRSVSYTLSSLGSAALVRAIPYWRKASVQLEAALVTTAGVMSALQRLEAV